MPPIFYSSAVLLWLTLTIYWLVNLLRTRTGSPLVNPVVLTSLIMIIYLKLLLKHHGEPMILKVM